MAQIFLCSGTGNGIAVGSYGSNDVETAALSIIKGKMFKRDMGPCPLGSRRSRWAACASRQSFYSTDRPSDYWLTAHV